MPRCCAVNPALVQVVRSEPALTAYIAVNPAFAEQPASIAELAVPESRPIAVSETEKSSLSVEVTGPMFPAFHEVPAASRTTASVTRPDVSLVAISRVKRGLTNPGPTRGLKVVAVRADAIQ